MRIKSLLLSQLKTIDQKSKYTHYGKFMDSLRIYARGGTGGRGLPKYGGIGGNGGNVYVVTEEKATLSKVLQQNRTKRFIAGTGTASTSRKLLGDNGEDIIITVPSGVTLKNDGGLNFADLNTTGEKFLIARGGLGGNPDNHFLGLKGQTTSVVLDLKLIADIGLVGFPNAGKSTFLSAISRAHPKIAEYPFTTLKPQIGIIHYDDLRQISIADLPGLIEGSHVNMGLGHRFLKHVERTKLLLIFVDLNGFRLSLKWQKRSAFETILLLNRELELYKPHLVEKPAILVINKVDKDTDLALAQDVINLVTGLPASVKEVNADIRPDQLFQFDQIVLMSAKYGRGFADIRMILRDTLDHYAEPTSTSHNNKVIIQDDGRCRSREDDTFFV